MTQCIFPPYISANMTKEERKSQVIRRQQFLCSLISRKFGTQRGSRSNAARALGISTAYLSNMMNQLTTTPDHIFAKLVSLPDYQSPYFGDPVKRTEFLVKLGDVSARRMHDIAFFLHKVPALDDDDNVSAFMIHLINNFYEDHLEAINEKRDAMESVKAEAFE